MKASISHVLANIVLVGHLAFVAFVVLGLALVYIGGMRGWQWVRNPWFRSIHVAAIAIVVLQAWLGMICPLTTLEMALRAKAGEAVYTGGFIAHWLQAVLYWEAPAWVFTAVYTMVGFLIAASWFLIRPRSFDMRRRAQ